MNKKATKNGIGIYMTKFMKVKDTRKAALDEKNEEQKLKLLIKVNKLKAESDAYWERVARRLKTEAENQAIKNAEKKATQDAKKAEKKAAQEAKKAAQESKKAEKKAEREAKKAEKKAAQEAKAEREAKKAAYIETRELAREWEREAKK